jgi:hypothetical protein
MMQANLTYNVDLGAQVLSVTVEIVDVPLNAVNPIPLVNIGDTLFAEIDEGD